MKARVKESLLVLFLGIIFFLDLILQDYFRGRGVGVFNQGISFGWLPGLSKMVIVIAFLALLLWTYKEKKKSGPLMVLLGGLGNLWPRLWQGGVWDYIYWPRLGFWFNLSDMLITIGVICYIAGILEGDGNPNSI